MKNLKGFNISFAGLAEGVHYFDYQINNRFLVHFEESLVKSANVTAQIKLEKHLSWLDLHIQNTGTIEAICDICNEPFDLPIEGEEDVVVKFVEEVPEDEELGVIYLNLNEQVINVATILYERLMLSIPMRTVHPLDEEGNYTCDPETLQYLNAETEDDVEEDSEEESVNPIWKELQKLKKQ